ncbi:MAG: hypothetical protein ABI867_39630 [Kofleriaceae bacterium]
MAPVMRGCVLVVLAGCGDLVGFAGEAPPLATIELSTTGDFEAIRVANAANEDLRIGLVWGTQWLPEPLCFLPAESDEAAAAITAGCRNSLAFTPDRIGPSVAIAANTPAELTLFELPSADVMFGDVTARVAYASLVVFDDRDHDGILELERARRPNGNFDDEPPDVPSRDIIYGASFVAMTEPDTRLAFREGAFFETGFYPRHGCSDPLPAFSLLAAGGFTLDAAIAATAAGVLPSQDPATCSEQVLADATIAIPFRATAEVREVGCEQRREDSSVRYRQPPVDVPDFEGRTLACAGIPAFGGEPTAGIIQLVVSGRPDDTCRGLTHYTLFGCDEGTLECDTPEWDFRENPPAWWPCL